MGAQRSRGDGLGQMFEIERIFGQREHTGGFLWLPLRSDLVVTVL